jgi:hypothetical protein
MMVIKNSQANEFHSGKVKMGCFHFLLKKFLMTFICNKKMNMSLLMRISYKKQMKIIIIKMKMMMMMGIKTMINILKTSLI